MPLWVPYSTSALPVFSPVASCESAMCFTAVTAPSTLICTCTFPCCCKHLLPCIQGTVQTGTCTKEGTIRTRSYGDFCTRGMSLFLPQTHTCPIICNLCRCQVAGGSQKQVCQKSDGSQLDESFQTFVIPRAAV